MADAGRVIAGSAKGIRLAAPGEGTRPLTDRVKQTLFAILEPELEGAAVLDLFAGSGAGAIEALSRGAASAVLVDQDTRPALGNVQRLGLADRTELVRGDVERWLSKVSAVDAAGKFGLVFVDAPYRLADRVNESLDTHLPRLLTAGGRAVVESGARRPLRIESLEPLRQRRYGAADVTIYGERA